MKHRLSQILFAAALLVSGNIAWGHSLELEVAAQRFEKAARAMQQRLYHHYGRSHLTRAARALSRQARDYRRVIDSHQPPRHGYREFAELKRCYKHFRHDWRWRPVTHHRRGLDHAAVNLRRAFFELRHAQRNQAHVGEKRRHAWETGS